MKNMNFLKMMNLPGRTWALAAAFALAMTFSSTAYAQPGVLDFTACKTDPWIFLCTPVWNLPIMAPETSLVEQASVNYDAASKVLSINGRPFTTAFAGTNVFGNFEAKVAFLSPGATSAIRALVNADGSLAGGAGNACGDGGSDDFCLTGEVTDPETGTHYGPGVLLRGTIAHFVFKKQAISNNTYDGTLPIPFDDFEFHIALTGGDMSGTIFAMATQSLALEFFGWSPRPSDLVQFPGAGVLPYSGDNPFVADFTEIGPFGSGAFGYVGPTIVTEGLFNSPPVVDAGSSVSGAEGSAIGLGGVVSDPDAGDTVTTLWTYSPLSGVDMGATCSFLNAAAPSTTITCTDDGVYTATLTGNDGHGHVVVDTTTVTVANVAPTMTITAPLAGTLYAENVAVNLSVNLADGGASDKHTCSIKWDDGTSSDGTVAEANGTGTCTAGHPYVKANVYTIEVTVKDDDGASATATVLVVVHDPTAGFLTGGGWYNSLAGADLLNPGATGQAVFGFVAKYKKGATVPEGATAFYFKAGNLMFTSTAYEWLVVTGGCYAQYKGTGKINGVSGYSFMITVRDGKLCGGVADGIRVKITGPGGLRYDNTRGATDDIGDTSGSVQAIAGGSIVIHR